MRQHHGGPRKLLHLLSLVTLRHARGSLRVGRPRASPAFVESRSTSQLTPEPQSLFPSFASLTLHPSASPPTGPSHGEVAVHSEAQSSPHTSPVSRQPTLGHLIWSFCSGLNSVPPESTSAQNLRIKPYLEIGSLQIYNPAEWNGKKIQIFSTLKITQIEKEVNSTRSRKRLS